LFNNNSIFVLEGKGGKRFLENNKVLPRTRTIFADQTISRGTTDGAITHLLKLNEEIILLNHYFQIKQDSFGNVLREFFKR
jgi:hypothetical protein